VLALMVKLTSRGPAFFGDPREGLGAEQFRCWKFRTMRPDAHALQRALSAENLSDGPHFKMADDPRLTPIGGWLRRLNLDELPQLFNVMRREMSFVGPRPSPTRENQVSAPWRQARLSVRPGITGLWQVCRHRREEGDFHQWIEYDMLYVEHCSLAVDVRIFAATLLTGGGRRSVPVTSIIPRLRRSHRIADAGARANPAGAADSPLTPPQARFSDTPAVLDAAPGAEPSADSSVTPEPDVTMLAARRRRRSAVEVLYE
jgi:lipopolysaccharide/colanic/teichoic acid biosynthesis glycosyltransferase